MIALDTNVLVYAADRSFPEHARCRALVERLRADRLPWYLTWSVIYEFLRVTTHPRVLKRPWRLSDAWRFVEALLASPSLTVLAETHAHAQVVAQVQAEVTGLEGNPVHDLHIAASLREHGVTRLCTRDTLFHRFAFLTVVDPSDA
jgi:toxin-antitoxin system PIN domain toxin